MEESAGPPPVPRALPTAEPRRKVRISKKTSVGRAQLFMPPCSTTLPGASNTCQGVAPTAAPVASLPQALTLRGLIIQWPFSQLLLAGVKTTEVRSYGLGYKNPHVLPDEEMWLIETTGTRNAPQNAIAHGACLGDRPERARIVGTVTFSGAERYTSVEAFRTGARSHCIAIGGDKDWDGSGERFAWSVASVKGLQTPIPAPRKTMTGLLVPTTFTIIIATSTTTTREDLLTRRIWSR